MRALQTAATGMMAQQMNVDVISHNIANMTTTGYKRERAEFQDLLYQNVSKVGTNSSDSGTILPTGLQLGLGVKTAAIYRIGSQGNLINTENPLDVGIDGEGFFEITMPDGSVAYTRAGSFQLSPDGIIVTNDGYPVNPAITVPTDALEVSINRSGEVQAKLQGQAAAQTLGQITLTRFINKAGLEAIGENLLIETPASGQPVQGIAGEQGFGTMKQGFVETSNVDSVTEITNLISAQRAYEMNSKVISAADEILQTTNNVKR